MELQKFSRVQVYGHAACQSWWKDRPVGAIDLPSPDRCSGCAGAGGCLVIINTKFKQLTKTQAGPFLRSGACLDSFIYIFSYSTDIIYI